MPDMASALAKSAKGDLRGALADLDRLLEQTPGNWNALTFAGELHMALGEPLAAAGRFRRAVDLNPASAPVLRKLASAEIAAGRIHDGIDCYRRSLTLGPPEARAHNNLGRALEQIGAQQEAMDSYRRALDVDAGYALASHNLGNLLARCGDHAAALDHYQRALTSNPALAEAWYGSARSLLALGRADESLERVDRSLSLKRPFPEGWWTRALALMELQRSVEAFEAIERALNERPDYPEALCARGDLLRQSGDSRGAVDSFKKARDLQPEGPARIGAAIAELPALPADREETLRSRRAFETALVELEADLHARPCKDAATTIGALQPFYLAYQDHDNRDLMALHGRICCESMEVWRTATGIASAGRAARGAFRERGGKLRIGIVSAQVFSHSVHNAITRGWLGALDRDRFDVQVFDLGHRRDAETDAAAANAARFIKGRRHLSDWARTILDSAVDVLLYPEVGMDTMTLQLASLRLAPVQAASWGHPQTTGLSTIDYYLSAEAFEAADADAHYTETLIRLPNLGCFLDLPPSTVNEVAPAGRPAEPQLICPGTPFKYAPEHDRILVDIAQRLGACRFHFFGYQDGLLSQRLMNRLRAAFAGAGLSPDRFLTLHPWAPVTDFRRRLREADLMLDTVGFSGFNTALHALECSLPIVAYRGRFMRGRLASGLVEQLGLPELAADSPAAFVDTIVELAQDGAARHRIKAHISDHLHGIYQDSASIQAMETFLLRVATP